MKKHQKSCKIQKLIQNHFIILITEITFRRMSYNTEVIGRVLSISSIIEKKGCSKRRELFVLSNDGLIYRITLWPPFECFEILMNDWISLNRFQISNYFGKTLSSKAFSVFQRLDTKTKPEDEFMHAKEVFGGIKFESIQVLKDKVMINNKIFGFLSAKLISYDMDYTYMACSNCRKSLKNESICTSCPGSKTTVAIKLSCYFETGIDWQKIVFFNEPLSSLFGFDVNDYLIHEENQKKFLQKISILVGKEIRFKVKMEKKIFVSEEIERSFTQITGMEPMFVMF